ncbi:hypothetical protein [Gracilimonas halophila]|uniref:Uncharacterized protein n=1 Tax=Gracilimonas halophila TaxID=1834464 RepID=A0ABW5JHG5_9BACT
MKKLICTLTIIATVGYMNPLISCITGGEGAESCSYDSTTYFMGIPLSTTTHSVSCGDGQYACCTEDGAGCVYERPTIIQG